MVCTRYPHVQVRPEEGFTYTTRGLVLDIDRFDYLADLIGAGVVPAMASRSHAPGGVAWPGITPPPVRPRPRRHSGDPVACGACRERRSR